MNTFFSLSRQNKEKTTLDLVRSLEGIPRQHWALAAMIERGWPSLRDINCRYAVGEMKLPFFSTLMRNCNIVPCFYILFLHLNHSILLRKQRMNAFIHDWTLLPFQQNLINQKLAESSRFDIEEVRPKEVYFVRSTNVHLNHAAALHRHPSHHSTSTSSSSLYAEVFNVHLTLRHCTCGEWQHGHLPCNHALAVLNALNKNMCDFIDDKYYVHKHKLVYSRYVAFCGNTFKRMHGMCIYIYTYFH